MNYINEISILGLMNKTSFIDSDLKTLGFYKRKDKKKVVYFNEVSDIDEYEQVNFMYLDSPLENQKCSSMDQIVSIIDDALMTNMPGKDYREMRQTVNKFRDKVEVKPINSETLPYILDMIEKWRYMDNGGMKYGWVEHAGIDKAILNRFVNEHLEENIIGLSFWIDDECIGYSMIERNPSDIDNGLLEYKYLTRKVLNITRNITEYVDWYTFHNVYKNHNGMFLINWGCSSGGVHWYKTHKWPVYNIEKKYFCTLKNSD